MHRLQTLNLSDEVALHTSSTARRPGKPAQRHKPGRLCECLWDLMHVFCRTELCSRETPSCITCLWLSDNDEYTYICCMKPVAARLAKPNLHHSWIWGCICKLQQLPAAMSASPREVAGNVQANPFGSAKPVDAAAKLRELDERDAKRKVGLPSRLLSMHQSPQHPSDSTLKAHRAAMSIMASSRFRAPPS